MVRLMIISSIRAETKMPSSILTFFLNVNFLLLIPPSRGPLDYHAYIKCSRARGLERTAQQQSDIHTIKCFV